MSERTIGKSNEFVCVESDERGRSVVFKDGTFYYKNTYKFDNCTANVYMPIIMKKKENN